MFSNSEEGTVDGGEVESLDRTLMEFLSGKHLVPVIPLSNYRALFPGCSMRNSLWKAKYNLEIVFLDRKCSLNVRKMKTYWLNIYKHKTLLKRKNDTLHSEDLEEPIEDTVCSVSVFVSGQPKAGRDAKLEQSKIQFSLRKTLIQIENTETGYLRVSYNLCFIFWWCLFYF